MPPGTHRPSRERSDSRMFVDRNAVKGQPIPVTDGLPAERRGWAVAAIFTALAMASLDTAIANVALPAISANLRVSPAEAGGGRCAVARIFTPRAWAPLDPATAMGALPPISANLRVSPAEAVWVVNV